MNLHGAPPRTNAAAAHRAPQLGDLTGQTTSDPLEAARTLDDADPIKRALSVLPMDAPCHAHLFMRTPRYDKEGREIPVVLSRIVELGYGAFRGWTPYYMTGDHQEIVVRYDAVARVLPHARQRCKLSADGAVIEQVAIDAERIADP